MTSPAWGARAGRPIACSVLLPIAAALCTLAAGRAPAHDPISTRVTWNGEVGRIVRARCVSCHVDGGKGPMPLVTYRDARPWAKAIKEEVLTRRMPKWHAVRGYGAFRNDPSLSPFEIALIAAWADGGAPEGQTSESARRPERSDAPVEQPPAGRIVEIACGNGPLPDGTLLAISAHLPAGDSLALAAALPGDRREPLIWIRDFDPAFRTTYVLRTPLTLPRGSALVSDRAEGRPGCRLSLTMARPR